SISTSAQDFSDLDKSPMDAVIARNEDNSSLVRIIYSSPQKRGREIFGGLVPFGELWRTGANEATEITFFEDINFNGKHVLAGTYSLFTIPGKEKWTVIINKITNAWGTFDYEKSKDVVRIETPANQTAATVEKFSITFRSTNNGTNLLMGWDDTFIEVPITNKNS
ncbi:MAG: DUF2911 domain-containing protein, partial [Psychroflexus sp.]|nr:DUF2911 domain-containing protein [Psychroflexus sp.]